jgi:hypothetical protein
LLKSKNITTSLLILMHENVRLRLDSMRFDGALPQNMGRATAFVGLCFKGESGDWRNAG